MESVPEQPSNFSKVIKGIGWVAGGFVYFDLLSLSVVAASTGVAPIALPVIVTIAGAQVVRKAFSNGNEYEVQLSPSELELYKGNPSLISNIPIETCASIINSDKIRFRIDRSKIEVNFSTSSWVTSEKSTKEHFGIQVGSKNNISYQRVVIFSKKDNCVGIVFAECYDINLAKNLLSLLSIIEEGDQFESQYEDIYYYIKLSGETFKIKKMIGISLTNEYEHYKNQLKILPHIEEYNVQGEQWNTIRNSLLLNFALQQFNNKYRIILLSPFSGNSIKPLCESTNKVIVSIIMELLFIIEDQCYSFEVLWYRLDQIKNYFLDILIPKYLKKYDE